jgi:2-polyprenyl-6-methoxyphenol hydroxylase-like FAD-dependent oxidoreductase
MPEIPTKRGISVRVLIAGAGIAGLTTALSLHAAGIEAQLVDSAPELKPLGVGINLLPHAVRELTELGLGPELEATGIATSQQAHFDRHGSFRCSCWPRSATGSGQKRYGRGRR